MGVWLSVQSIVAVHGLGSGALWSWSHPVTGKNWLRDFLPNDLKHQARIMAFDYWSNWGTYAQIKTFEDFAVDLLVALEDRRNRPEVWLYVPKRRCPMLNQSRSATDR